MYAYAATAGSCGRQNILDSEAKLKSSAKCTSALLLLATTPLVLIVDSGDERKSCEVGLHCDLKAAMSSQHSLYRLSTLFYTGPTTR